MTLSIVSRRGFPSCCVGDTELAGGPRPEWVRDGAVMLFGVVMALRERQPWAFMGWGGGLPGIGPSSDPSRPTSESEEIDRCSRLARTAGHRAGVAPDNIPSLIAFLIRHRMMLPVQAAVRRDIDLGLRGPCTTGRPQPRTVATICSK